MTEIENFLKLYDELCKRGSKPLQLQIGTISAVFDEQSIPPHNTDLGNFVKRESVTKEERQEALEREMFSTSG